MLKSAKKEIEDHIDEYTQDINSIDILPDERSEEDNSMYKKLFKYIRTEVQPIIFDFDKIRIGAVFDPSRLKVYLVSNKEIDDRDNSRVCNKCIRLKEYTIFFPNNEVQTLLSKIKKLKEEFSIERRTTSNKKRLEDGGSLEHNIKVPMFSLIDIKSSKSKTEGYCMRKIACIYAGPKESSNKWEKKMDELFQMYIITKYEILFKGIGIKEEYFMQFSQFLIKHKERIHNSFRLFKVSIKDDGLNVKSSENLVKEFCEGDINTQYSLDHLVYMFKESAVADLKLKLTEEQLTKMLGFPNLLFSKAFK